METQNDNSAAIVLLFTIAFFIILGWISANFLITSIIPVIGIFNLILIPIAWELFKQGCKAVWALLTLIFESAKLIDKE